MNKMDLFCALNDVNDEFILEASDEYRKIREKMFVKWKPCIIGICVVYIFLFLTIRVTEHMQVKEGIQEQMEGGDTVKLYVQGDGESAVYISTDGAVSWSDTNHPGFYMQLTEEKLTDSIASIPIRIVNDSKNILAVGTGFSLLVWDGNKWTPSEADGLFHHDMAFPVPADTSYEMACDLQNIRLNAGKYLLTKTVIRENDRSVWMLSTEFTITKEE